MTRFERTTPEEGLPSSIGSAADRFKSSVEREVREIVEEAQERASEIQDAALRRAAEIEGESRRRAEDQLAEAAERAGRLLDAINSFEREVGAVIGSLRGGAESLVGDLESARSASAAEPPAEQGEAYGRDEPAEASASPAGPSFGDAEPVGASWEAGAAAGEGEEPAPGEGAEAAAATDQDAQDYRPYTEPPDTQAGPSPQPPDTQPSANPPPMADTVFRPVPSFSDTEPSDAASSERNSAGSAEARALIRAEIVAMYEAGKPREDAEHFLTRFKQGEHYLDLVDEVYLDPERPETLSGRRRGLFRRGR